MTADATSTDGELVLTFAGPALDAGTYPDAELRSVEPFVIEQEGETRDLLRWTFAVGDAKVEGVTSRANGPKSKQYGYVAALLGRAPVPGERVAIGDLIGRRVVVQVELNAAGYAKVAAVLPAPKARA